MLGPRGIAAISWLHKADLQCCGFRVFYLGSAFRSSVFGAGTGELKVGLGMIWGIVTSCCGVPSAGLRGSCSRILYQGLGQPSAPDVRSLGGATSGFRAAGLKGLIGLGEARFLEFRVE